MTTGEDRRAAKLNVELAQALEARRQREVREQLQGPIHGLVQTISGMCSDELPHEEIDAKLAELADLVYGVAETLRI